MGGHTCETPAHRQLRYSGNFRSNPRSRSEAARAGCARSCASHRERERPVLSGQGQPTRQADGPRRRAERSAIKLGEVSAALQQAAGLLPPASTTAAGTPGAAGPATEFPGAVPSIKDYQVSMDGDIVRGQFLTQIAGKDVYLTLAGHLGSKGGYATFDATEVKVGDLSVPASLINGVLQKKLAEQRDQLKLPENVKDIKVENGELVFVEK